ncbi:hypothetical protein ANCCAN_22212 [Ancylostoma caninum]|uniref:Uncharacterized protein n=1 Tax=Ancylostoma caninum TaxID=29170 RepID=A0A368FIN8_ANCCA|nr:hypothetical protein ANCCAN_22212 [Ancylostoma caninum]
MTVCTFNATLALEASIEDLIMKVRKIRYDLIGLIKTRRHRATKSPLSYETLELIRQRGSARAAGNYELTSELAKRCREAIKEDHKE